MASMGPAAKKKRREQEFRPEYSKQHPFIIPSALKGPTFAFCKCCNSHFSIARSGAYYVRTHMEDPSHKKKAEQYQSGASSLKLTAMFCKAENNAEIELQEKVMAAEVMLCELIAELNLPISSANTFTKAFGRMFPDSRIAQKFQCSRTKTTAVIKELAEEQQAVLYDWMRNGTFTISTDGSHDSGEKQFPLVVRTVSPDMTVASELLAVPTCNGSATGEAIFNLVDSALKRNNVPWTNCLAVGSDNAAVMVGKNKGVIAFAKKEHPDIYQAGCTLHLVHIAAEKGADQLPYSPAELLQDIYFYLKKSSVRQHRLETFQQFHGVEQKKILKHVDTRWLSTERCLDRLLENWDALKDFFEAEHASGGSVTEYTARRLNRIVDTMRSPTARLYMLFLQATTRLFTPILTAYQSDEPKIQDLMKTMIKLQKDVLSKFVKPCAVAHKLPQDVDFTSLYNIKEKSEIFIGDAAKTFIATSKTLRKERVQEFYSNTIRYYQTISGYLKSNLPLQDDILHQLDVVNPSRRLEYGMMKKLEAILETVSCTVCAHR